MTRTHAKYSAAHAEARENLLDAAIDAGKFPESRRHAYAAAFDSNPDVTCRIIATMSPVLAPVRAGRRRASSSSEPAALAHRSFLSAGERRTIEAAERGERQLVTHAHD